jgi:thiol:disulfide interchange protein DsbD
MRYSIIFLICLLAPTLWAADSPLLKQQPTQMITPVEQAFQLRVGEVNSQQIHLEFTIAPGTYLYQKEFVFKSEQAKFKAPIFPEGKTHEDPYFGKVVVYEHTAKINLPIDAVYNNPFPLTVSYQGCNDIGFCYPPQQTILNISLPASTAINPTDQAMHLLQTAPLAWALFGFFGFGLLLAFTPCMLPMIPILSALIIGEQHKNHRLHALRLALTYVFAMACTYACLGALVASLGAHVQAQLQNPIVLTFTALVLVAMAILLFNEKALAYVSQLNNPLNTLLGKFPAGKTLGVAAMGVISALIISPCVTPPLIGALTYISTTGNVLLGASALFLLALGMGTPLLIVAWGGTALLPKHGPWLNYVKYAFAVILLLMAASLVARFVAPHWGWGLGQEQQQVSQLSFTSIKNVAELDQALAKAKAQNKPVMLDFYADWCTTCITLEHSVFTDPVLSSELAQLILLKADVTDYNDATQALMSQWQVYGPPVLLFFDAQGNPVPNARVDGLITAPLLSNRIAPLLKNSP